MIIYPSLPSGYTIFCDDIRVETTGKITLVGTYNTHMFIASVPTIVPRLCCSVFYRESQDTFGKVVVRLIHETGSEEVTVSELEYEVPESDAKPANETEEFVMREARMNFEITPFSITGPGQLKVRAYRDNDEIRLGTLKIEIMPMEPQQAQA